MTQQLTIIDQVKDIESKSGVAFEIDVTQLSSLAERGKAITSVEDPNFVSVKKEFQQTRKYVKNYMMDARSEFNKLAKGVIEVERMILSEVVEEEDRLIALDKAEKERVIMEARLEALPKRKERLEAFKGLVLDETEEDYDDFILKMEDADFEIYVVELQGKKNEADRIALAAEKAAMEADAKAKEEALAAEKAKADEIEKARKEERERAEEELRLAKETAEREAKEAEERREREAKEAEERREREIKEAEERRKAEDEERRLRIEREEREAKEKIEREKKEAEEAEAKRLADEKYQAFLKENKYNENTDILIEGNKIYRFVAEYVS